MRTYKRPKHYRPGGPIACIDAQLTPEMRYGFYAGNVIKYTARAHLKGGQDDLAKADWYMQKLLALKFKKK